MFSKPIALLLQEGEGTVEGTEVRINKNGKKQTVRSMAFSDVENVYLGDRTLEVERYWAVPD